MNSSIISFPQRGGWGQFSYRGNCSGFVQKSLIETFRPGYFVDPAEGGGTSRDVCRQMGVKYTGLDLSTGFNLLKDKLKDKVDGCMHLSSLLLERDTTCFIHQNKAQKPKSG